MGRWNQPGRSGVKRRTMVNINSLKKLYMKNWLDLDFTLSRDLQEKTRKQFKLFSWVQFKQV